MINVTVLLMADVFLRVKLIYYVKFALKSSNSDIIKPMRIIGKSKRS